MTTEKKVHQGKNVKIRRTSQNVKQEELALLIGLTAQNLSLLEKTEVIDDKILNKIAKELDTDVNWFKTHDPVNDVAKYIDYSTNTNTASDTASQTDINHNGNTIYYPVDEIIKLTNEALALQKEGFESEKILLKESYENGKALLKQNYELLLKNALLEKENELLRKK